MDNKCTYTEIFWIYVTKTDSLWISIYVMIETINFNLKDTVIKINVIHGFLSLYLYLHICIDIFFHT